MSDKDISCNSSLKLQIPEEFQMSFTRLEGYNKNRTIQMECPHYLSREGKGPTGNGEVWSNGGTQWLNKSYKYLFNQDTLRNCTGHFSHSVTINSD